MQLFGQLLYHIMYGETVQEYSQIHPHASKLTNQIKEKYIQNREMTKKEVAYMPHPRVSNNL